MVKKLAAILFINLFFHNIKVNAQTTHFADGYHGGIYGHYPLWVTKFIKDSLQKYKDWRVNLEIEPETWDTVAAKDAKGYEAFKDLWNTSPEQAMVEYVNPAYGQSYLYNIEGESIIRQFQYGMQKLKQHFPAINFTTYSSEEPCFTSALPQILKSLGFKYAVLKNPNTCWGGYTRAYGGEAVNWQGPDGTSILTVPRYASEGLLKNSTWQTTAWNNSAEYLNAAFKQGIKMPVGMCLQDAGWTNGPWLDNHKPATTQYIRWRDYFAKLTPSAYPSWRLSQEDIQVSLVWGAQVLQRIAQQVRAAENKIISAEKIAALARLYGNAPYPSKVFDEAWRTLLLSQHHDCWIVPYNGKKNHTWADEVKVWTDNTIDISDSIIMMSNNVLANTDKAHTGAGVVVSNPTNSVRKEWVTVNVPANIAVTGINDNGKPLATQQMKSNGQQKQLLFPVTLQPLSYKAYQFSNTPANIENGATIKQRADDLLIMETDLYRLVIDTKHGGTITHLIAKQLGNKNFVSSAAGEGFNGLRGNFYTQGGLQKNIDHKAAVTVLENGPYLIKIQLQGTIALNNYMQTIQLVQGQKRIDCGLHITYAPNTGIGENYMQDRGYTSTDLHKAFYNDTSKLLLTFPLAFTGQKVYKDAPFDVTESKLTNTFFNRWDSIKNNVLLHWVDVTDKEGKYGLAVLTNHTTNYVHGENFPLAITVQYAGAGLWGRNYTVDGPTDINYAIIPHEGTWKEAGLNTASVNWNEPLQTAITNDTPGENNTFIESTNPGIQVTAMQYQGDNLLVRFYNSGANTRTQTIRLNCFADKAELVELDGRIIKTIPSLKNNKVTIPLDIPLFGVRTIRLIKPKAKM